MDTWISILTLSPLSTDLIIFNPFNYDVKPRLLKINCVFNHVFNHEALKMFGNFHPFEVVDRGSDPQLQVGENLN